jgi:hypothetical protein
MLRHILVSFLLLGSADGVLADPLKMLCHNSKASYVMTFDAETQSLSMDQGDVHMKYIVSRVQSDEDGVLLAGRVSSYGTQFVASFQKDKWMRNFYGNGSSIVDRCE